MPVIDKEKITAAYKIFKSDKVITVEKLVKLLECSVPSVRNRLKLWETYTSYNHNGKYYTLPDIPEFNQFGIWNYKDIRFSKSGNLGNTLVNLVRTVENGLSANEIGEILGLSPRSFLSHFKSLPGIYREKQQGKYIYFSGDCEIRKLQIQKRGELISAPSETEAIQILVEFIKNSEISVEELSNIIEKKYKRIEPAVIQRYLESQDLFKKKTVVSRP